MPQASNKSSIMPKVWDDFFNCINNQIKKVSRDSRYFWVLITFFLLISIPLTVWTVFSLRDLRPKAATGSLCYDFSGDGVVGEKDVEMMQPHVGYSQGQPQYDPKYDIVNNIGQPGSDGNITALDFNFLLQHYGDTCPPTVSFTTNKIQINKGGSATLTWSTYRAGLVSISHVGTNLVKNGQKVVSPTSTKTYILSATGPGGTVSKSITITVIQPAPTLSISADNTNIAYNTSTTIRWSSTKATSCTASNAWSGSKGTSGSKSTGNLTSKKTYTLSCSGAGGTRSASVTVNVLVASQQQIAGTDDVKLNFVANPYLQGLMQITTKINDTSFSEKAAVSKEAGTFVLEPANVLTKNKTYVLQLGSLNSLVQKVNFKYVNNTTVNIGEFVTGDFNSDNLIDTNDLDILTQTGITSGDVFYDINYDGVVNSVDYSLILINQGKKGN